jgi:flagellar hook-associated protein 3 FlgL
MAMRITTKMMQSTSLRNLNTNKYRQENLMNQMSTGKKITRPSDDPVIAIRSLKLNSTVDKIDQFYEKNAADADSWLDLTRSALSTVMDVLKDVRSDILKARSNYNQVKDRDAVIKNLKMAIDEIYSTGNADSAGRSVFTGYRTDMPLSLKTDKKELNTITEQFFNNTIDKINFVYAGDLSTINEGNFKQVSDSVNKDNIFDADIYRKRLAYDNIDIKQKLDADGKPLVPAEYESNIDIGYMSDAWVNGNSANLTTGSISAYTTIDTSIMPNEAVVKLTDAATGNVVEVRVPQGKDSDAATSIVDSTGAAATMPAGVKVAFDEDGTIRITNDNTVPKETASIGSSVKRNADGEYEVTFDKKFKTSLEIDPKNFYPTGTNDAYKSVISDPNAISYIAETGEVLFGDAIAKRLMELPADKELRVTYDKTNWKKNDLDPVHYFYTERAGKTASGKDKTLVYNENFLTDPSKNGKQIIEYDVGNNQTLRVNTTADEAFTHDMGRDMQEVIAMLEEYERYETSKNEIEKMIESGKYKDTDDELLLKRQKEALEEAMTRVGDKISKRCDKLIANCDGYSERAQLAETDCGARMSRLAMVENRLSMEQTNFEELVSINEDADYTDLVIQLKSIEMTYNAALSSISYVMQTSLLDFIR